MPNPTSHKPEIMKDNKTGRPDNENIGKKSSGFLATIISKVSKCYEYVTDGVWKDPRNNLMTRMVKTLNLTMSALTNSSLQTKSMALTYSTVLSIVPAFALLVAIGRGFGLQDVLQDELYKFFPSQGQGISAALRFVDSYLKNSTEGIFVGVGIVVLLWTVISLLSSIEDTFNSIWGVTRYRTLFQKITDYIAICLIIPILMICSSGMSIFMSSVVQAHLNLPFLTPLVNLCLEFLPLGLCWLAFTFCYCMIPNTKVSFKYAAIAGALAAISFQILQLLFLNGQIYVSKYNAIYGSFAFLPLMLIWLQLSWLVLLTGCMIAYSMQNVFTFNLMGNASAISDKGWHNVALIIMAVCVKRFAEKQKPLNTQRIAVEYFLPIRIVEIITAKLKRAGLIYEVNLGENETGITPAIEPSDFTVAQFFEVFDESGITDFIPDFKAVYADMIDVIGPMQKKAYASYASLPVKDVPLPAPDKIRETLMAQK